MSEKTFPFYINISDDKVRACSFAFWGILAYALLSWLSIQINIAITADTLWLCEAAERLLSGIKMSDGYFDPNPPLSVLLYIPPVLIAKTGIMPIYTAAFFYTLIFLGLFGWLTWKLLQNIPGIDHTAAVMITSGYVVTHTILVSLSYTERDQIIGMALLPFVLSQLRLTYKWQTDRKFLHLSWFFGAILILIKPHHGLIPTILLLHRAIIQRRLTVWKDPDFLYLAGSVLAYGAILQIFFKDYLIIILPDVLDLYLGGSYQQILAQSFLHALLCITGILVSLVVAEKNGISRLFFLAALLSLIPYITQMHGYHYHLIPAATFFWCGLSLLLLNVMRVMMHPALALTLTSLVTIIFAYALTPTRLYFPNHYVYQRLPIGEYISKCEDPCPFFILNDHIEITHQTSVYLDKPWASRFPSFWFLPQIFLMEESHPEKFLEYRKKYAELFAEDLDRYKPKLVLIGEFPMIGDEIADFVSFFEREDSFNKAWASYKRIDDFKTDQQPYFAGTKIDKPRPITYRVYQRSD